MDEYICVNKIRVLCVNKCLIDSCIDDVLMAGVKHKYTHRGLTITALITC